MNKNSSKPIRHVVAATDFTTTGSAAVEVAFQLARAHDADLTIIHAHEPVGAHYPGSAALLPELIVDQIEASARERIVEQLTEARDSLVSRSSAGSMDAPVTHVVVADGDARTVVCELALKAAADLIVIGSHGKSQVSSWLLGSVTRDVAAAAHCPVLVVKAAIADNWSGRFSKVVTGIDFSEVSSAVVDTTLRVLEKDARLTLFNSWNISPNSLDAVSTDLAGPMRTLSEQGLVWATQRLDRLREDASLETTQCDLAVRFGKPADELTKMADEQNADLLVVGSHARDDIGSKLLGTVAERVLRQAKVPVLMIPTSSLDRNRTATTEPMDGFEQLNTGSCKTYLIWSNHEAMIVDPLFERVEHYAELIRARKLSLRFVIDTHVHADHLSGGPALAAKLATTYVVHKLSNSQCASQRVVENDRLSVGKLSARVIHSPGHATDAICLQFPDRLLTGDALFIDDGGAGRTDLPGGDPAEHWDTLRKLDKLDGKLLLFPGHDYSDREFSTLAEQRINNPHFAPRTRETYIRWLGEQRLGPSAWMVDVIAANYDCEQERASIPHHVTPTCAVGGTRGEEAVEMSPRLTADELGPLLDSGEAVVIDVREPAEWNGSLGHIDGAHLVPLGLLATDLEKVEPYRDKTIVTVCRSGVRSDSAAALLGAQGFPRVFSLDGGMRAWRARTNEPWPNRPG